jgi:hypothetical protein
MGDRIGKMVKTTLHLGVRTSLRRLLAALVGLLVIRSALLSVLKTNGVILLFDLESLTRALGWRLSLPYPGSPSPRRLTRGAAKIFSWMAAPAARARARPGRKLQEVKGKARARARDSKKNR